MKFIARLFQNKYLRSNNKTINFYKMNWVKSLFGSKKGEGSPEGHDMYREHRKFKTNGELYVPAKNKEGKSILFSECDLTLEIGDEDRPHSIKIVNLLYDPDQENIEEIIISIDQNLQIACYFSKNIDGDEVRGYSLYNKNSHYLFQFLPNKDQKADALEVYITQLMFEAQKNKPFIEAKKTDLRPLCPYFFILIKSYL